MIKTLLIDADGVLQHGPFGWYEGVQERTGATTHAETDAVERPFITGDHGVDMEQAYAEGFPNRTVSAAEILDHWNITVVDAVALELVDKVREGGVRCFLASNQQPRRAAYMRTELPYSRHLDGLFFSAELGIAKPDPGFFEAILTATGAEPSETLFLDDVAENVEGARSLGINAEVVPRETGAVGLAKILRAYDLI